MDQLVRDYQNQQDLKKRSKLFTKVRAVYLPKIMVLASKIPHKYYHDLMSEYNYQLILHLERWTGINKSNGKKCSAKSYLYWAVVKAFSCTITIIKRDKRNKDVAELLNDILREDLENDPEDDLGSGLVKDIPNVLYP